MELYQLEYFLEVARQRNFTRAAARLHLAQAALSEQIRKLEAELGAPLFQRGRRESVLTAAGQTLQAHAERLLEQAAAARRAVHDLMGLRGGRLVIGAIPSASACLLPKPIAVFRRRFPQVELRLAEGTSETIADWLESGRVELGIVQLPTAPGAFVEHRLLTEPFVLLVPRSHPLAATRRVALAAFRDEAFIFYKGRARDTALAACRTAGFEPRMVCESGELETVRALVAAGLGLAILPRLAAGALPRDCVALPIRSPHTERHLALLTRAGQGDSPAVVEFRKLLER